MGLYAEDGKCHNAELSSYGQECGKPAKWLGTDKDGFRSGFCAECKERGREARLIAEWVRVEEAA